MTCTTASGLLPAGMAVYVQRGAERSSFGNTIFGWAVRLYVSKRKTRINRLLPAWEAGSSEGLQPKQSTCGLSIRTATGQCGLSTSTASWRPALAAPIEITDPAVRRFNIWSGFFIDSASRIDEAPVGLPHSSFFVVHSHDGKF